MAALQQHAAAVQLQQQQLQQRNNTNNNKDAKAPPPATTAAAAAAAAAVAMAPQPQHMRRVLNAMTQRGRDLGYGIIRKESSCCLLACLLALCPRTRSPAPNPIA
jgi:hypothetical protein